MKGIKASPGIAIGKAYILVKKINTKKRTIEDVDKELKRLDNAMIKSSDQLQSIKEKLKNDGKEDTAKIFEAHNMILQDVEFINQIKTQIKNEKVNSEYAVYSVTKNYEEIFNKIEDKYLRERAADVRDVGERIIFNLMGKVKDLSELPAGTIIVAEDLVPSDTATLDRTKVSAFVTETGGTTSHTAIISRIMEIPAVVGAKGITSEVKTGDTIIVDGNTGEIIINPDSKTIEIYNKKRNEYTEYRKKLNLLKDLPAITLDGKQVLLEANIGTPNDMKTVLNNGAEGIGLFRTEFVYMDRDDYPTEDEQFEQYKEVISAMNGKRVTIRTLDIGGDKDIPYFNMEKEANPFLGCRAIRLCFKRTDMFKTQLKAILRAAVYGNVSIMYPMISDLKEVLRANEILDEAKKELEKDNVPYSKDVEVGIMVEIPSAAVMADKLAEHVDFFSIGTNDLTQYTLAVDRGNSSVKEYYNYFNPAVIRLIKNCIDASHKYGKYTAMCGEMASNPDAAKILLGLGLDAFSMSAGSILEVKNVIRNTTYEECKKLAQKALEY